MQSTGAIPDPGSAGPELADALSARCVRFLHPFLVHLDAQIDARLVRTLAATVTAVIRHRDRPLALLLSELGAVLAGPTHAPAGTKRLANLLHSPHWQAKVVAEALLTQGREAVIDAAASVSEGRALCILDGSVVEKPESAQAEGLAPVRSAKARRLARPRPKLGKGYWQGKPGGPIVVPGWQWLAALVTTWAGPREGEPLTLGAWYWYRHPTRAEREAAGAESGGATPEEVVPAMPPEPESPDMPRQSDREAERVVLEQVVDAWGAARLLHVWDRGFSGGPWLGEVLDRGWHFVVRWKKGNHLRPADAPSVDDPTASFTAHERDGIAAWRLTAGLRPWGERQLPDPRTGQLVTIRYAARPVRLLHRDEPLWLVVVRLGRNPQRGSREPWRLLTTEPVTSERACWRIVEAYAARWQIEQTLRFAKSELGIESVRVRRAAPRHKLLAVVSLAYAFLISLLPLAHTSVGEALLRWAHRTGTQNRLAIRPLYRLRAALAALWQQHTPNLQGIP